MEGHFITKTEKKVSEGVDLIVKWMSHTVTVSKLYLQMAKVSKPSMMVNCSL
jgi:hypothetical protein